jgi:PIN domain nuclease of toxin-antitoxin system
VRILLDTHVFLWLQSEPERVGAHLELLGDAETERLVSAASAWEIAIKHGLGRLELPEPPATYVPSRIAAIAGRAVPIEVAHATAVASLPPLHRDPFDRLLIAQALALDAVLLTADDAVAAYPVKTLRP